VAVAILEAVSEFCAFTEKHQAVLFVFLFHGLEILTESGRWGSGLAAHGFPGTGGGVRAAGLSF